MSDPSDVARVEDGLDDIRHIAIVNGQPGIGIGFSLGTAVLLVNATLLWLYSLSCHACRHLCGGGVKQFSKSPIRHRIWKTLTPLSAMSRPILQLDEWSSERCWSMNERLFCMVCGLWWWRRLR